MIKLLIISTISIIAGLAAYFLEPKFYMPDIKDYCNALLIVSGMVFTIMGIWIAFVYPNAIKRLQDPEKIKIADFTESMQDTRRLESIVDSIMQAGFVAISILLFYLAKIIISAFSFFQDYNLHLMSAGVGFIIFISLIQLSSVFSVIYANYLFIHDLHSKREAQERMHDV